MSKAYISNQSATAPARDSAGADKRRVEDRLIRRLLACDALIGWSRIYTYTVANTVKRSRQQITKLEAIANSLGLVEGEDE